MNKPKIVISKCLGFDSCRYNGQMLSCATATALSRYVDFVPVCPECEIGLGVPRVPLRILLHNDSQHLVQNITELDCTEKMAVFSDNFLSTVADADGFILKNRSPSCGIKDVKVYPSLGKVTPIHSKGQGIFGGKVLAQGSLLAIEDDGRLKNFELRNHFYTKLFTYTRFKEVKKSRAIKSLIDFHSDNKLLFFAYNEIVMRDLGKILAAHKKDNFDNVLHRYEELLNLVFPKLPKAGTYVNVLLHAFGYFKNKLMPEEKKFFLSQIDAYTKSRIPLIACLNILKSWTVKYGMDYLTRQTVFEPFPEDLSNVSDSGKGKE